MKGNGVEKDTLDGVIADLERVRRTWRNGQNELSYATLRDALEYLKEHREKQDQDFRQAYIAVRNEILFGSTDGNPPLSWDELKQMEGKPVWISDNTGTKHYEGWALILDFQFLQMMHYVCADHTETCVVQEDLGKTWNAYRKERS